ncbi:MAG: hypothetical protein AMXMBFR34_13260 [Myxococcaceae bacterium]
MTQAQRVALTPIPGSPVALAPGSGVDLALRMVTDEAPPRSEGGAVAVPTFQPELGAVIQVAPRTRASVKIALAPAALGATHPVPTPEVPTGPRG